MKGAESWRRDQPRCPFLFVMMLTRLLEILQENNPDAQLMEPRNLYDPCIVGLGHRFNDGPIAIYSLNKVFDVQKRWQISEELTDPTDIWFGNGTPIYVWDDEMLCDTHVTYATPMSHGVPENCRNGVV